ncbi:MAG: hypothetical protein HC897_18060 [Thermoanaerobaculia bacterium]|nr:hypothetical protein [Thermoanaerobaculia bacterium]
MAKRLSLGLRIAKYGPWTQQEEALLGTAPDREVALRIGRTLRAVRLRRVGLQIPAFVRAKRR